MKKAYFFLLGLVATLSVAAQTTFPVKFTTADGLPAQTTAAANSFKDWMSPVLTFAEPVSSFRMTVTHTSWQDAYCVNHDGGKGYVFFTLGEFYLKDAAGNDIALSADNFASNAYANNGDGSWEGLCDGDISTHFHTCYSTTDQPRPIGAEHYLEVTLPEPMTSFQFGFYKRSNNANIPSEIILTAGGVDADPYAEFGFELGEKVTTIEPNNLYVFADEGQIKSDAWEGQITTYLATGRDPRYSSPAGTDTRYRIRRVANADCVFKAIPADDDMFYLYSFIGESYIASTLESNGSVFIDQALDIAQAAKFQLDEEGYLVSNSHYYATNSQETLVAYDHPVRALSIFKASIDNKFLVEDLKKDIAKGDEAITKYKQLYADLSADQGETAALEEALKAAKAVNVESASSAILSVQSDLQTATVEFLKVRIFLFVDELNTYLDEAVFDNTVGNYPSIWEGRLANLLETVQTDIDTRSFATSDECQSYINTVQEQIDSFLASKIEGYTEMPVFIDAPEGQAQLGTKVDYSSVDDKNKEKYVYESPVFILENPAERFYVTFLHTNSGDAGGGWECTALAEFEVYDGNGKKVDLAATDFSTNAQEPTEGPMEGICDGDLTTFFHTLWSSKNLDTNEHWVCVELPQSLSCFSFRYITRGTGIAPKNIVVSTEEPYHYVPTETIGIKKQVTSVSELDPDKYYIFYGNINKVSNGEEGTGYYAGITSTYGELPLPEGVFKLEPGDDGGYKIHFLTLNYYLKQPTGWEGSTTTANPDEAGVWFFEESPNLADAFKVYVEGSYTGNLHGVDFQNETMPIVLQDWSGSMGYYPTAPRGWVDNGDGTGDVVEATTKWQYDDTDGESDWYIFETDVPAYLVPVKAIHSASQLNTEDTYAMYGNLGVLTDEPTPGGYYRNVTAVGEKHTNFTLFKLEPGSAAGTYKVHFLEDNVYLKNPTTWQIMEVTENADEAAELYFEESTRMDGAFWIYTKAKFTGENAAGKYTDADAMYRLQDWGDSGMGAYPIISLDQDDADGESDWIIKKVYDIDAEVLNRDDYLGEWTYYWDNYWNKNETKSFDFNFVADPDDENGLIMDCFDPNKNGQEGSWSGVLDPIGHTITFQGGQIIYEGDERYYGVVRTTAGADQEIVFTIDLLHDEIYFGGQLGVVYDPREEGESGGGWWMLSSSKVWLVQRTHTGDNTKVDEMVVEAGELISTEFYNLKGQRISAPEKGMNIIRRTYDNGVISVQKVLVR